MPITNRRGYRSNYGYPETDQTKVEIKHFTAKLNFKCGYGDQRQWTITPEHDYYRYNYEAYQQTKGFPVYLFERAKRFKLDQGSINILGTHHYANYNEVENEDATRSPS